MKLTQLVFLLILIQLIIRQSSAKCGQPGRNVFSEISGHMYPSDYYEEGASVNYSCPIMLLEHTTRSCKDGKWSGEIPSCREIRYIKWLFDILI